MNQGLDIGCWYGKVLEFHCRLVLNLLGVVGVGKKALSAALYSENIAPSKRCVSASTACGSQPFRDPKFGFLGLPFRTPIGQVQYNIPRYLNSRVAPESAIVKGESRRNSSNTWVFRSTLCKFTRSKYSMDPQLLSPPPHLVNSPSRIRAVRIPQLPGQRDIERRGHPFPGLHSELLGQNLAVHQALD